MKDSSNKCGYVRAYGNPCQNGEACGEHYNKKCKCGGEAVKECETAGSMTCGAPLCMFGHDCNGRGNHPHY